MVAKESVPAVFVPSAARNSFPAATSAAVAVVTDTSSNLAVPPPVCGSTTAGTSAYDAPSNVIFLAMVAPCYEMLNTFVDWSWVMIGAESVPVTEKIVTPAAMFCGWRLASPLMVWTPDRYCAAAMVWSLVVGV